MLPAPLPGSMRPEEFAMNRRGLVAASAGAALSVVMAGLGGDVAEARKRRKRGGSAYARASITGKGGSVSVSVNCGSGQSSNQASGPPSHGSHDDGAEVSARC
jgi:hypothetical protein